MPAQVSQKSSKPARRPQSLPVIGGVLAVVALLVFIGFLGWRFVGPGSKPANGSLQGLSPEWMVTKAKESQGDIDKLSPEDKQKLISRWGEQTARVMWQGEYRMVQANEMNQPPKPGTR